MQLCTGHALRLLRGLTPTVAILLLLTLLFPGAVLASVSELDEPGVLSVELEPSLEAPISVDGVVRSTGRLRNLELPAGSYELCFGTVPDHLTPPCQEITVPEGAAINVIGSYEAAGELMVTVEPERLPALVSVDGVERAQAPVRLAVTEGSSSICFADVTGYSTPDCVDQVIVAGARAAVVGRYERLTVEEESTPHPGSVPESESVAEPTVPGESVPVSVTSRSATSGAAWVTSLAVGVPEDVTVGEPVLLLVAVAGNRSATPPAGFELVASGVGSGGAGAVRAYVWNGVAPESGTLRVSFEDYTPATVTVLHGVQLRDSTIHVRSNGWNDRNERIPFGAIDDSYSLALAFSRDGSMEPQSHSAPEGFDLVADSQQQSHFNIAGAIGRGDGHLTRSPHGFGYWTSVVLPVASAPEPTPQPEPVSESESVAESTVPGESVSESVAESTVPGESVSESESVAEPTSQPESVPEPEPSGPSTVEHGFNLTRAHVGLDRLSVGDLTPSGPIVTSHHGQVIEGLDIQVSGRNNWAVGIRHNNVVVRNNRIRHPDGGQGVTAASSTSGALIEHNVFDAVYLSSIREGHLSSNNDVGQRTVQVWGTGHTIRRNHVLFARSAFYVAGNRHLVSENFVEALAHEDGSSPTTGTPNSPNRASLHGTAIVNFGPSEGWTAERNVLPQGGSGGLVIYSQYGSHRDLSIIDNYFYGTGRGFAIYGGRSHSSANYSQNRGIRIEGNRFSGTFGFLNTLGRGTNAAVDLSRPGNTFINNRFVAERVDLPAHCGISRSSC